MAAGNFTQALAKVLVHEGGKCDDPRDPGGRTNCGITHIDYDLYRKSKGLAPRDVYDMDNQERDEIYRKRYWDVIDGDTLPSGVDYVLFDGAVNSGAPLSVKWLQRSLGGLVVDGELGPATLAAATNNQDLQRVAKAALQARREFLQQLKTFSVYGKGWIKRVDDVQAVALAWIAGQQLPVVVAIPNAQAKATRTSAVSPPPTAPGDVLAAAAGVGLVTTLAIGSNAVTVVPPPGPADQSPAGAAVIADASSITVPPNPAGPVAPPAQIVASASSVPTATPTNPAPVAPPPSPIATPPSVPATPQPAAPTPQITASAGPTAPNAAPVATAPSAVSPTPAAPDTSPPPGPPVKIDIAPPPEPSLTASNATPTVLPDKPAPPAPVTVPPAPSPSVAVAPPSAPNPAPAPMPAKPAPPSQASVAVAPKPSPAEIPSKPIAAAPSSASSGTVPAKPAPALPSHASVVAASKTSQVAAPIPSPRPEPPNSVPAAIPAKPVSAPVSLTSIIPKQFQGTLAIPTLHRPVIAIPENQLSFIATGMGVLFASGLVLSFTARHAQSKLADALGDTPVPKTVLKFAETAVGMPVPASPGTATPMAFAKKAATRLLAAIWIAGTIAINVIALAKLLQILGVEHMDWHGPFVALGNFYDLYAGRAFAATSTFVFNQVGVTLPIWLMPVLILYVSMASAFVVGGTGIVGRDTSAETFLGAVVHASWILAIPVFVVDAVRYQVVTRFARQNTMIFLAYIMTFSVIYIGARYVNDRYMASPAVAARATAIMMQIGDSAEKKALALKP